MFYGRRVGAFAKEVLSEHSKSDYIISDALLEYPTVREATLGTHTMFYGSYLVRHPASALYRRRFHAVFKVNGILSIAYHDTIYTWLRQSWWTPWQRRAPVLPI
jgi:hypothetical protein